MSELVTQDFTNSSMLQKFGKIKFGHFFLREYMQVNAMAIRMILSLLKLVTNSRKYSTDLKKTK